MFVFVQDVGLAEDSAAQNIELQEKFHILLGQVNIIYLPSIFVQLNESGIFYTSVFPF